MGTPNTHTPPAQVFVDYTLTQSPSDLTEVPDAAMTLVPGSVGTGFATDAVSAVTPIGFNFAFNGTVYSQFVVSTSGWVVLVDPVKGTFSLTDVMTSATNNTTIKPAFAANHVLLALWFDDLYNVSNTVAQGSTFASAYSLTALQSTQIVNGFVTPPVQYNPTTAGVKYKNIRTHNKGRQLVVRWSSISDVEFLSSTTLRFDLVLCENGTIEYRYAPRSKMSLPVPVPNSEGATIGVFTSGSVLNSWRDFSLNLGYRRDARQLYAYGGSISSSYVDSNEQGSATYTVGLTPFNNWPGGSTAGSCLTFAPPVNERYVLPRKQTAVDAARISLPLVARTGDPDRLGTDPAFFDDRLTVPFGATATSNYPTTMTRLQGDTGPLAVDRQDLFATTITVPGQISPASSAPWQHVTDHRVTKPFDDAHRPEQTPVTSSYFLTGSFVHELGFDQELKSKTQLRLSFNVDYPTSLLPDQSAIYYYNRKVRTWEIPQNAGGSNDIGNPLNDTPYSRVVEDVKGFGPVGNFVTSGSNNRNGAGDGAQTSPYIGGPAGLPQSLYSAQDAATALTTTYSKDIRISPIYSATDDETFQLPINQPFLIEKVVIELPFSAGPGWFSDITQAFAPADDQSFASFDFGGPAMTLSLFNQLTVGATTRRDLILTGTITHAFDNTKGIRILPNVENAGFETYAIIAPTGFLSYANPPGFVVPGAATPGTSFFTGSVAVPTQALVSNGITIDYNLNAGAFGTPTTIAAANAIIVALAQKPAVVVATQATIGNNAPVITQAYINPFGRSGTLNYGSSGRSIMGGEFVGFAGFVSGTQGTTRLVANPFYLTGSALTQFSASLAAIPSGQQSAGNLATTAIVLQTHTPSPYLVNPGDKLVLALSKCRPFWYSSTTPISTSLGTTAGHDVTLQPGTVRITLYGSEVVGGAEYHDTLNQPLASDAVHELIGAGACVDQFSVEYRDEFSGSYTDRYVAGSMGGLPVPLGGRTLELGFYNVEGQLVGINPTLIDRQLVFSYLNAENVSTWNNASKSTALQPAREIAGDSRLFSISDYNARIYDSMVPNLSEMLAVDGAQLVAGNGNLYNSGFINSVYQPTLSTASLGVIVFDTPVIGPVVDNTFTKAFPFEPKYAGVTRLLSVQRGFTTNLGFGSIAGSFVTIPATDVPQLLIGFGHIEVNEGMGPALISTYTFFADVLSGSMLTGSLSSDDSAKILYGYGDDDTRALYLDGQVYGPGNMANHRDEYANQPGEVQFNFSPVIRGWRYGLSSGLPQYAVSYFRRDHFGQFRDRLEQPAYTRVWYVPTVQTTLASAQGVVGPGVVEVKFINTQTQRQTDPALTWSSNLDTYCTSSLPYFDGLQVQRPVITPALLNKVVAGIAQDIHGNLVI